MLYSSPTFQTLGLWLWLVDRVHEWGTPSLAGMLPWPSQSDLGQNMAHFQHLQGNNQSLVQCIWRPVYVPSCARAGGESAVREEGRKKTERWKKWTEHCIFVWKNKIKQNLLFCWGEKIAPQGHLRRQNAEGKSQKNIYNGWKLSR